MRKTPSSFHGLAALLQNVLHLALPRLALITSAWFAQQARASSAAVLGGPVDSRLQIPQGVCGVMVPWQAQHPVIDFP
jgi:hypothetical protein